jgi:16S rRNA (cytidine1402-2'-O)-methyltransferase
MQDRPDRHDRSSPGTIYVVATPIGNLEDITQRAVRILGEVDLIAAEDTRRTRVLLQHLGLRKPTISFHDANERTRTPELVRRAAAGESIALVSDAGTPLIADPGYRLVCAAIAEGVRVVPVPGASAPIALLSCAGLATDRFTFLGFLPNAASKRRRLLASVADRPETLVMLESPRRVAEALDDLVAFLGPRDAAIGRELTKVYEEVVRGRLDELARRYASLTQDARVKGEIVIAVAGARDGVAEGDLQDPAALDDLIRARIAAGESISHVARGVAEEAGLPRRAVYQRALALRTPGNSPGRSSE